jgi:hypothetical protein
MNVYYTQHLLTDAVRAAQYQRYQYTTTPVLELTLMFCQASASTLHPSYCTHHSLALLALHPLQAPTGLS